MMDVDMDHIEAHIGPSDQPAGSSGGTPCTTSAEDDSASPCTGSQHSQKQHLYRDMGTQELMPISTDSLPGIVQHCRGCLGMLKRMPLFSFDADILRDLMFLYVRTSPDRRDEQELQSTGTQQVLRRLSERQTPNRVLQEGEAGSGEGTGLREYAHSVCQALLDCHHKAPHVPCPGHQWKFISAWAIQGKEAIIDSPERDDKHKDGVMSEVTEDAALLVNAGVDEVHSQVEFYLVEGLTHCLNTRAPYIKALLLYVCSNKKMRNIVKLTTMYICGHAPHLLPDLTFMVQACLVLQTERQTCKKTPLTEGLLQLPAVIQYTLPQDGLSHSLPAEHISSILDDVSTRVVRAFSEDAEQLQQAGWLLNGFRAQEFELSGVKLSDYQRFVWREVLQQCTISQQEEICSQTTHRLLPCTASADGRDWYMMASSSTAWTVLQLGRSTGIHTQCPQHVIPALTPLTAQDTQLPQGSTVFVYLTELPELLGEAPQEAWSRAGWAPTLRELLRLGVGMIHISAPYLWRLWDRVPGVAGKRSEPLDGLLEAAQDSIPNNHRLTNGIHVKHGWVSEGALYRCVEWARLVSLTVVLEWIEVVESEPPEGGRGQDDIHSDLQHRVEAVLAGSTTHLVGSIDYK